MIADAPGQGAPARLRVRVRGRVQGVGFRPFVHALAVEHGLAGWVRNDEEGVLLEIQGAGCGPFLRDLTARRPPLARIEAVEVEAQAPEARSDTVSFQIHESAHEGHATAAVTPDAAVCSACLAELFDPRDRRHRYAFLNCTHCGPRFTITRSIPYDRPRTSMAPFAMCEACAREYHDPADRRFHAQPVACPRCGPRISMPIEDIVARLVAGEVVALKGLGGFHLACDARLDEAVERLRARKERHGKPFAVMVASVESARAIAHVGEEEARLLEGPERPVVLLRRRDGAPISAAVAPDLAWVGVMLPSTPLHYLLFHEWAGRPEGTAWLEGAVGWALVMTSANPGGEPLVVDDAEAERRLQGLTNAIAGHDREIVVRTDDSVLRVIAGAPRFVRRARGYAPEGIPLGRSGRPVLALGGHLKATACVTREDRAYLTQHVGDLDDRATQGFLEEAARHLRSILEVEPAAVAHDLHPEFHSTQLAASLGLPLVAVQHHHAHVAAVLAEHGREGPAIGIALDGFGLGDDGGLWGGELLLVDGARMQRLGHFAELRQPGGDAAARQPWRMAAATLHRMGRREEIRRFVPRGMSADLLLEMLDRGVRSPWTSSCGRLFDAAAALLGVRLAVGYEGEAPMVLESLVTRPHALAGGWTARDGVLDFLPLLEALLDSPPGEGADLLHGTLIDGVVEWALPELERRGLREVALGGGCLMNQVLAEGLVEGFAARGIDALLPRAAPANDGGLSLGQAWVALRALEGG